MTPATRTTILEMLQSGSPVPAIVTATGVHRATIRKVAKAAGIRAAIVVRQKPKRANPFNRGPL